jgi:hypothetical protein
MQNVLRGLQWEECVLYIDDVFVPGASYRESLLRMEHTFDQLLSAGLKFKPSKCIFLQTTNVVLKVTIFFKVTVHNIQNIYVQKCI